jgi:hypothetical protein
MGGSALIEPPHKVVSGNQDQYNALNGNITSGAQLIAGVDNKFILIIGVAVLAMFLYAGRK